jgi:exonuclease III
MSLTTLNWNIRRAGKDSHVWNIIDHYNPDIITLQEVSRIPDFIIEKYSVIERKATKKNGINQKFSTAILSKGEIFDKSLNSDIQWINNQLDFFNGNLIYSSIKINNRPKINVISVYSPAWPIDKRKLEGIDISRIKLNQNPDVWCTEILWAALKYEDSIAKNEPWIISGDFNSSVTFDYMWSGGPSGNQEIIDRMNSLGLTECLANFNGKLIPTFKNKKGGKIIHQLDHIYVTDVLFSRINDSKIDNSFKIFENSLSDHLPIITTFDY